MSPEPRYPNYIAACEVAYAGDRSVTLHDRPADSWISMSKKVDMKILAVSTWFPIPPDNGARIRTYQLLRGLSERNIVDLLAIYQSDSDMDRLDEVRQFCRRAEAFPSCDFQAKSSDAWWRFFSLMPRSFEARHNPDLEQAVTRWSQEEDYDAVLAISLGAAEYVRDLDVRLKVLDQHNVESLVLRRQSERERSILGRLRYTPTWIKASLFERHLASEFDLIAMTSEPDRRCMGRLLGDESRAILHLAPNGVDTDLLKFPIREKKENIIVFTGAMTYSPNLDAAKWLCRQILPEIRRKVADARLIITGKYEGIDISEMAGTPGVEFTGYVDDIRPVLSSASALLVPIRYGGGTRLKILEAMAIGCPVVSTPVGAEGIDAQDERDILIGERADELATQTLRLLTNSRLQLEISQAARELMKQKYLWPDIVSRLENAMVCVGRSSV